MTTAPADHHSEYLAAAIEALSPDGRSRVDELLEQLAQSARGHEWVLRFAHAREAEADAGRARAGDPLEPGDELTRDELDTLIVGFRTIRDQEPLDDVADWANAVLAFLQDERRR